MIVPPPIQQEFKPHKSPLHSAPRIGPLQQLAPRQPLVLLLPTVLTNSRVIVVERLHRIHQNTMRPVDAVPVPLLPRVQARIDALLDLVGLLKIVVVVAAREEVVDFDAHDAVWVWK